MIININGFYIEVVVNYDHHMVWCWLCISLGHIIKICPNLGDMPHPYKVPHIIKEQGGHHGNKVHANPYPWHNIRSWQQPQSQTCFKQRKMQDRGERTSWRVSNFFIARTTLDLQLGQMGKKLKASETIYYYLDKGEWRW